MSTCEDCAVVVASARSAVAATAEQSPTRNEVGRRASASSPYDYQTISDAVARLFIDAGWDAANTHLDSWNPLGAVIPPDSTVLVKPNWVHHENFSGAGLECLVTNSALVRSVLDFVIRTVPRRIVVGDAPIQGCDMPLLLQEAGVAELQMRYAEANPRVEWADLRRSRLVRGSGMWQRLSELRPLDDYVLFDLGSASLLEPISDDARRFRVTMYDPDVMPRMHAPGRHKYLIARDALDADVVVNLPKLKTHKKAGITGALKNLVGINGDKDFLPHHRRGGSLSGGDCYQGGNVFKSLAEAFSDAANRRSGRSANLLHKAVGASKILARLTGADSNLDGSWYGNDTVWRMGLDLNRILLYGKRDGTLAHQRQRKILTITDAVVCGEGDGPLSPTPHYLGLLTMSQNPAAADFVHSRLMGLDWRRIPIVREAFGAFPYPIAVTPPESISVQHDGARNDQFWLTWDGLPFVPPRGWIGHVEAEVARG